MRARLAEIWRLAALLPALALGGCHLLLLPCGAGCHDWLASLPPHDNVMSLALGGDLQHVEGVLTGAARYQYAVLERRWPPALDCAYLAQPGCRYSLPVRAFHRDGLRVDAGDCATLDVVVEAGADGRVVRRTGYRPMRCPDLRSTGATGSR